VVVCRHSARIPPLAFIYIPICNSMLSNFDLEELSEHFGFPLSQVLMKDEMKSLKSSKNGNYIINLQASNQGNGSNWMALAVRSKDCFYCDSFGVLPPQEIITFCKRIPKSHLGYNDFAFQNIKAETCGWYCVGLLIHIQNHPNMDLYDACRDYIKIFSYDTTKNNAILKAYFRKLPQSKGCPIINSER
jgi:hypothetical protein